MINNFAAIFMAARLVIIINNFQQFFSSASEPLSIRRFIATSFANEEHQQRPASLSMRPPAAYRLAIQQTPKKDQSDPLDYQSHMPVTVAGDPPI